MRRLIALSIGFWGVVAAIAGDLSLLGTHPTSPLSGTPAIHVLKAHDGRIYMGYGDWNGYPVVVIASYDPASNAFRMEHSAPTDSIGIFRSIGNKLYVPSIDPVHFEEFQDYSVLDGGTWRSFAPAGLFHAFDMGTVTGSDLWVVGSKSQNETASSGGAVLRSIDDGRTWSDVSAPYGRPIRYHWCFPLRGKLYVEGTVYNGNIPESISTPSALTYKAASLGMGDEEFVVAIDSRLPGFLNNTRSRLISYDATAVRELRTNVYDFTVEGGVVYTLEAGSTNTQVWVSTSTTATQANWQQLPLTGVTNARSIEVLGGIVYMGDNQGRLWAGRIDGSPIVQNPATITNLMPDGFGRAFAVDGSTLVVGAADFSGAQYLCGQATVWQQAGAEWQPIQTIDPPNPLFSGLFGKAVALSGDALALLEGGVRGGSAQVHLYERSMDQWQLRQRLSHPFAHSVALTSNRLAVATTGQLHVYRLTRTNQLSAAVETNFAHNVHSDTLYEPIGRVAMDGEKIAYGIVGDFSRQGGPGQVNIYERNVEGAWVLVTNLLQNTPPLPNNLVRRPDAFGFALDFEGNWLAVGAPRDDTAARQGGALHLYERLTSGTVVSYILRQTIPSPVRQAEARFGESISLEGAFLVVGAPGIDSEVERQKGRVFVYRHDGTNWAALGEINEPAGARVGFGSKVVASPNLAFAGCKVSTATTDVAARIAMAPFPDGSMLADLEVAQMVSSPVVTNGGALNYNLTVSNRGPATATLVHLVFPIPGNLQIESVSSGAFNCTNTGSEVRCSLSQFPANSSQSVVIQGRATVSNACESIRSEMTVAAREFDPSLSNNQTVALVNFQPAQVSLIEPPDGTTIPHRGLVTITASSSDTNSVSGVGLYANGNLLKGLLAPPYSYQWTNITNGIYALSARATNLCGIVSTSSIRTLIVGTNMLPQLAILHPANGTRFPSGTNVSVVVSAYDPDGTLINLTLTGIGLPRSFSSSPPPYNHVWSNVANGTYILQLQGRDNDLAVVSAPPIRIVVGPEQTGITNSTAYVDHSPGPGTLSTVTRLDIGSAGSLRNVAGGATLPAFLSIRRSTATISGSIGTAPDAGTFAAQIFGGYCDFVTGTSANVPITEPDSVSYAFSRLDPNRRYNFRGTAVRGNPDYVNRWTLAELMGTRSFQAGHTTGCLTEGTGTIQSNQAALNTGDNRPGEVVGWDNIQPARDGTFTIVCTQYRGFVPGGSSAGSSGYALTALRLEEVTVPVDPPPTVVSQPTSLTVSPGASAQFAVAASGEGAITYQWVHNNTPIPGATTDTLQITSVSTSAAGSYVALIQGETGSAASAPAVLTVVQVRTFQEAMERLAQLTINGAQGQRYTVEYQNTIDSPSSWMSWTNFTFGSSPVTLTDNDSSNAPTRFYRVVPIQ
jgi:uncharacterized repeat protein (TIGR01451 family)